MREHSHNQRQQFKKIHFKAQNTKANAFSSGRVIKKLTATCAIIVAGILLGHSALLALANKPAPLSPQQESLHVFPSVVRSTTWFNIETLGIQDLSEDSLFQEFNKDNSAYIDPSGKLPSLLENKQTDVLPSTENTTPRPERFVEDTSSINPQSSTEQIITDNESVPQEESNVPTEGPVETMPIVDQLNEGIPQTTESSVVEPTEPEPEPVVEESQAEDEAIQARASEDTLFVRVYKRVTDFLPFAQSGTTTNMDASTDSVAPLTTPESVEEAVPSEVSPEVVEEIITIDGGTETISVASSTNTTATSSEVTDNSVSTTSERIDISQVEGIEQTETQTNVPSESVIDAIELPGDAAEDVSYEIVLRDFGVPALASGQFINNLQLRLSLGSAYKDELASSTASLDVSYAFGEFAGTGGSVLLEEETSNALNGGYFLVPLPSITDPKLLEQLTITLSFNGSREAVEALYLDAVWLEVGTVIFDPNVIKQRYAPGQLRHLKGPESMEFLGNRLDFTRDELPQLSVRYNSKRNFAVRAVRNVLGRDLAYVNEIRVEHGHERMPFTPDVTVTPDGLITVLFTEADRQKLKPGVYTITFAIDEGGFITEDSFEFQWGMIAINTDKTTYVQNEPVTFTMGALSPNGNTVCDARLQLYVIDPRGFLTQEEVLTSGVCNGNNVTDVPDYSSLYITNLPGEYEYYLERLNDEGAVIAHTHDTFIVSDTTQATIRRTGPTRIYPVAPYVANLSVETAQDQFTGTLIERVPRDFDILETDATIKRYADFTELIWNVAIQASSSQVFSYQFDAPDISPYLYQLGPARLETENAVATPISAQASTQNQANNSRATSTPAPVATGQPLASSTEPQPLVEGVSTFIEHRQWQIASDATGSMILFWDDGASIPSGWTCLSCGSGTFFQRFVQGGATYNSTGGAASHTPTASGSVLASSLSATESGTGSIAPTAHSHTYTPTIGLASNLPAYRQLRVIQFNSAGEPGTIPAGAIGVFDVASSSLPSGWNRYAAQDGRYIRGEDTPSTQSGSNTHSHTITGSTGSSVGTGQRVRGGTPSATGATQPHTHTISSNTGTLSNEPPYIEVLLAKLSTDAAPPDDLIAMWTDEVPTGWLDVSSSGGDPFNGRFLKPASTYGSTGGTNTHQHADVTGITSSAPVEAGTDSRTGTDGSSNAHTHSVSVTSFSTDNHLPPYLTAIFGKRQGTNPVYTQQSYRWYANTNTETPTDPWPLGTGALLEREAISTTTTLIKNDDTVHLRMNVSVQNATATAGTRYQLQYTAADTCSAGTWYNVGLVGSTTAVWRGYNTSITDHVTLASTTLASTTVAETFEENGYATSTPNDISVGDFGEWAFVLEHNGALAGTNYCFRMVEEDGSAFFSYAYYPKLFTNRKPDAPTLLTLFDNEKTASTTPFFTFVASDAESEDVDYQIQIDNDYDFSSTVVDESSNIDSTNFLNLVLGSDKAPYNQAQEMQFTVDSALSNGVTYWWRVRARDTGSDEWSEWATPRSFTIDTSLTASAWFQTTQEQFDTDTLVGVESLVTDEVDLITGSTTGSMTSTAIDFTDASAGTAWDSLVFNDTETAGDILYSIEYYNGTSWALIPDADLAGNSSGFDTSPVSLLGLDTDTYTILRVVADFTDSAGSPSLQDWTINWGYRVETPTITKLFPNEKTGTTTPTFEFSTTDPQSDSLTYQISWSTDNTFTSSTTRTSDVSAGFINADNGVDTDPFISGDTIQFTVQSGDALSNNSTYWWRVRAKDTTGDNAYSFWTEAQSFTVDTTVTVSTWFQTTEEQFDTNILSGVTSLASDVVSVATTATDAIVVYGKGVDTTPYYREWDGSTWGSETAMADVGAPIRWVVTKTAPTRQEYITATVGTDGDINAQVFSLGSWGNLQEVTTSMGNVNARGFDIAYEQSSGDALLVFCDGDADPSYYVWSGSSWALGTSTINLASTNNCQWIKLASDPTSDEIILLARDSDGTGAASYEAQVWNGNTWGNSTTLGGARNTADEAMAIQYEESGGQALILTNDSNPVRFEYNSWDGAAWSGLTTNTTISDNIKWAQLVPDDGSDAMTLCYVDESSQIGAIRWTGSTWTGQIDLDLAGNASTDRAVSCIYETTSGRDGYILTAYSDTTNARSRSFNGSTWAAETSVDTITDSATVQTIRTGVGTILGLFFDDVNDRIDASSWNGSTWSTSTTIVSDAPVNSSPFGEPFMAAPQGNGTDGTAIVSPGVNFTDGVGPYWDNLSWNDTTPGTSDILYSVQYYDGDSWEFIPDGALPGNSVGTSTSPIDLSGLSIATYDQIRPYAALSCDGSGNCPELQDWTIEWAEGITVSGTIQDYTQSSNVTSGTVAVAVNDVLQTGKTGTIAAGAWSISNVTAFAGDIITVFVSDTSDATEAVGVTRYDGLGDVTGMTLYERHLTLGSNDATTTPLTNTDIALYNAGNDEDVFFDVSGSTLNACAVTGCADVRLFIKAGTYYQPGGAVSTHDIENQGILTATSTLYISGSWENAATTTLTSSTVIFEATSTSESIDTTGATVAAFNNVTFGTSTGAATWTPVAALDINGTLTVLRGTLARGTNPITVAGNITTGSNGFWTGIGTTTFDGSGTVNWSDQNATLQNVGRVAIDGTTKSVVLTSNVAAQSITIGADDIFDASISSFDVTVYGSWTNNNTFTARNGTVFFAATTSGHTITAGSDAFHDLTFSGVGGAWSFTESLLTVNNDFTVATGTVTMPTATTTIAGSFSAAGGTFAHNNAGINFTSSGVETIIASSTVFSNAFYNLAFSGIGSWTFLDTTATTSNDIWVSDGTVVFPSGVFTIGGSLYDLGGAWNPNSGTVRLSSIGAEVIQVGGSNFFNLTTAGSGSWNLIDSNATILNDLTISNGTLTMPSGTLSLGGSLLNTATFVHSNGTVLLNSTDTGETINPGSSSFYNVTVNGEGGGFTVAAHATTTNNFTLATSSDFTLSTGQVLSVGGVFTNAVGGASTTWSGSTLALIGGAYSINTKTNAGDAYGTLSIGGTTDIAMWNSQATTITVASGGSLYSQDHAGVDGALYIYGDYTRSSGAEYWSYATDFDGTSLSGSERQAQVFFADGASATLSDSTFQVLGTAAASSSIQNQGSGSYAVTVSGGTTTAQYYEFADLGGSGVSFLAGAIVSVLRDGSYTVGVDSASALTLSSTTIDANPAKQIYNVTFATTTAIIATNVTQTDGTPASYWWFRQGSGNLYGEDYDNDTGDPGSVRFDDSALVVTIAGTVYSDEGVTPITAGTCSAGTPVRVVVEGGATYDGACTGGAGAFSIPGVVIVGDPTVTVFLNGASGGEKAVAVTRTVTADVLDMDLYANRVIVRHEDTEPMTIASLAAYDFSDDTDINFLAATGTPDTLTVFANTELHVWATTTFTPGGTVTLHANATGNSYDGSLHIGNDATFTGASTTVYTIGGSLTLESGATFVPASSTIVMTATTTGKTITTDAAETLTVNELQFTGVGGGWNLNGNISATANMYVATGTVTGTGDITLTNGSFYGDGLVSLGAGETTLVRTNTLGGTQGWTFNDLTLGTGVVSGTTTPGSTATTTIGGVLTIGTGHFLDAGAGVYDLSGTGTVFIENGTFLEDTSTVIYSGTAATNITSTSYYNLIFDAVAGSPTYTATGLGIQVFGDLSVGPDAVTTVNFTTNDPALTVEGDMTIGPNGAFIASNSGAFTLAGSYDNNGTFTGSGGTLTFDGVGVHTIAAGNSSFSSVIINGTGDFTVTEHATATSAFTITAATDFTLASGQSLAVGGTFTNNLGGVNTIWTGSTLSLYGGGNYTINASTTADTYGTLTIAAGTQIRMWNSDAASIVVAATASLYSQDNANVNGDLYIYGDYSKSAGTDYWSYATDFDGTSIAGAPRQANVYVASGATLTYAGGGLTMIGVASASTTVQNQGSGTYGLSIGTGSTANFSYYQIRDTDTNGLVFTGTPTVTSISRGDFLVEQNNGTAITVAGSVINANPAKTFTRNIFASSTGITATNVTATGVSVSSWRFTNHTGNIAGENFDSDPDGDPGYLVWDDSAANITISGTVYSDEGTSVSTACDSATTNIHVWVAGLTSYTSTCNGDGLGGGTGAYSVSGVTYSPGDSIVVFINNETEKATTVTVDPVSNINNLDLYENRVIVRHENTDPITIVDMAVYDSSDDADIIFTAVDGTPDTLTLPVDTKLLVWDGKTFAPGGNITLTNGGSQSYGGTLELQANAVLTAAAGQSHTIGGSLLSGTDATFTASTATFTFTTSGAGRTIDTNDNPFATLVFNGSGDWTITNTILDTDDLTITAGTVTLPAATTTISGTLSNTGGSFDANGGSIIFDSAAAETIRANGSDFATLLINGTGSFTMQDTNATSTGSTTIAAGTLTLPSGTFAVGGDFENTGGTVTHNTSEIILTGAGDILLTASSSDLYAVTMTGGGAYTMTDQSITLLDSLTLSSGSLTLATGTVSIGGSFDASGGTFAHASGTILFNSTDTGEIINPGSSDFYNVNIASAGGGWTITSNATTTNNFTLSAATSFTLASGQTLVVDGVFTNLVGGSATTWTGSTLSLRSGTEYAINTKASGGDRYQTLVVGANTDLSAWNSAATTTTVAANASFYSQDHAAVDGSLYIYGDYHIGTTTEYWSYATDFDGTALGGSPRAVTVSIASGATTTLDGGTLQIIGTAGNETLITNQGSGQYAFAVTDGTLNAQRYQFRNLDASGFNLSETPAITSLNYGDFELAVSGGNLISLASTTLNANASLIITGARFATTSAITGTNVSLTGSTASVWTFVGHTGNLDGEAYDNDGGSACGQVRWDDSSCLLTQQTHYRWRADDGGIDVPDSEWYDANWAARKRVRLDSTNATNTPNAAIEILVTYDADMQTDFDDLRFTDSDGTTLIPHFIASTTVADVAEVWVQVPDLPANDTATIFMYYNNPIATSSSSATDVFTAADDFEDGGVTEYSGSANDKSEFTVDTSLVYGGTYGLTYTDTLGEGRTGDGGIARFDQTVSQGNIFRYQQYIDVSGGADEVCTLFGVQSPISGHQNYGICTEQVAGTDYLSITKNVVDIDSSGTTLATTSATYSTSGWYTIEVDWQSGGTIDVSLYDPTDTLIATTTASDTDYSSGGYGYTFWFNSGAWDNVTARPRVVTEPTVTFGVEQGDGGANWLAALDTAYTEANIGDILRLRFAVENTGLAVSDAYRLEYAEQGNAPSCEAVDPGLYATVPVNSSCGSSPVCMATSTTIANGANTTDLLIGPSGDFTIGRFIEDPSNTTASLSVAQDAYTEVEYAIKPNNNIDDQNLCFRVSDAGTDLDTYLRVAKLTIRFDPSFGAVSFNLGQDISLSPGTTTRVYATSTVTDRNGYTDLVAGTSTMYTTAAGGACSADNNNCYISTTTAQCSFTNCSGNSCTLSCYADIFYHADPTDSDGGQEWFAFLEAVDTAGGSDFATSPGIELLTLRALEVGNTINYGALAATQDTGSQNATTTINNIGNDAIDIEIEGTDLTDGASSAIPADQQLFATSTFTYSACVTCQSVPTTTPIALEVDLNKPTTSNPPVSDQVYWGIAIPFGTASNPHTGINIFYAIGD